MPRSANRVLLTGGAGGIGAHVVAHLLANTDWHITVLDSLRHKGDTDRLTALCDSQQGWAQRVTVLQHDLVCPISTKLSSQIGRVNYILHLAALSDVPFAVENPRYTIINNVEATVTMLDYATETCHDAFIYFSTDEVYGPTKKYSPGHHEGDVLRPSNPYAASKAAGELFCHAYWRAGHIRLIITNATNNFGETQGVSKYPAMIQQHLMRGELITVHGNTTDIGSRCYLHSRNTADALLHILTHITPREHTPGEIDEPDRFHITGDTQIDNLELAQLIADAMEKPLTYDMVDYPHAAHDIHYSMQDNRLRASGWKPPLSLTESVMQTVRWNQKHASRWL